MTRRRKPTRWQRWALDTAERTARTAAQAALPAVAVTGWSLDSLYVALGAAGVCLLMCVAGSQVGATDSASLLPADVDPPQDEGHTQLDTVLLVLAVVGVALLLVGVRLD